MKSNKLTIAIVFAVLGLFCWIFLSQITKSPTSSQEQTAIRTKQLQLKWQEVVAEGVSSEEKDRIVAFVDTFERAIAELDSDKTLSFFSEPATDEERQELDFILGSDIARDTAKPTATRLFATSGYNYSLAAHYVRNVSAQGANRRVVIDEMRIIPSGGEFVGTVANVSRLIVELRATSHGYEIARYYHEGKEGKYEGFVAE